MPKKSSRLPSRVPSRRTSRAASIASTEAAGTIPIENLSFVSHLSAPSHGVGGGQGADLDEITAAAAVLTGAPVARVGVAASASSRVSGRSSAAPSAATAATATGGEEETILGDDVGLLTIVKQFLLVGYPLSLSTLSQFSLNMVIVSVNGKLLGDLELGGASLATGLVNATGFAFGAGLCGAIETVLPHTFGAYQRECQAVETENAKRLALWEQRKQLERANRLGAGGPGDNGGGSGGDGFPPGLVPSSTASTVDDTENSAPSLLEPPHTLFMYGIYTQRMAVILFIVAFPLGVILLFADMGLSKLGESSAVLYYTGIWCRYAVFGVPATLAYQLIQRYYSCQAVTKPLSVAMVSAALINPLMQIAFVKLFGFAGSPVAWLLLMCMIVLGLVGYLKYTGLHKLTWDGWTDKSLQNLGSLTALAIPSMGVMLSEWVALEVNALAGGFAPTDDLAAYSITLQVFGAMWGIGSGVMILAAVFVGSAVGAQKPMLAKKIAFSAIGIMFCIAIIDIIIVYSLSGVIPWIFTNDAVVVEKYKRLLWYIMPYHIVDTFQSTVMGIFRGCGMQKQGAIIITIAFCVIGVPLSFLLFFYFEIGVRALWIGPFAGVLFFGVPSYAYLILRHIKWESLKAHTEGPPIPVEEEEQDDLEKGSAFSEGDETVEPAGGTKGTTRLKSDPFTDAEEEHVREYLDDTVRRTHSSGTVTTTSSRT